MIDPRRRDGPSEERSDIDLVIFLQNLTIDQHIAQLPAQLKLLESILLSANPPLRELKMQEFTRFAARFSVEGVGVDVLPAFGLSGPQDTAASSIKIPMDRRDVWPYYSKCFAEEQCRFVTQACDAHPNLRARNFSSTRSRQCSYTPSI